MTNSSVNENASVLLRGGPDTPFLGPYSPDHATSLKITSTAPPTGYPILEENAVTLDSSTQESTPTMLTSTAKPSSVDYKNLSPLPPTIPPSPDVKPVKLDHHKKKVNSSIDIHYNSDGDVPTKKIHSKPSSFFNPITQSPDIPIGVINPDKLDQESSKENAVHPGHPKGPTVSPAFLEHLLEYHKYQEGGQENSKGKQPVPPPPGLIPYNPTPPSSFNPNAPVPPNMHVNHGVIHPNNIQPPYNQQHPHSGKPDDNEDYDDQSPYVTSPDQTGHRQQIPPELYHLINQGYRDPYSQPNHVTPQQIPHQFLSPADLFHVNRQANPQNFPPQPPYNVKVPARQENNLYSHPNAPIGLADIIDHIKQHEKTDSRTKDTHVYVLASQPPNVGQGWSDELIFFPFD